MTWLFYFVLTLKRQLTANIAFKKIAVDWRSRILVDNLVLIFSPKCDQSTVMNQRFRIIKYDKHVFVLFFQLLKIPKLSLNSNIKIVDEFCTVRMDAKNWPSKSWNYSFYTIQTVFINFRKIIFIRGFSKITKVFFIQIYLIKNLLWQRKCSGASTHQLISVSRRKLISTKNISCRKINSNNFSFIFKSVQLPEVNQKEAIYCHWKGSAVLVVKNRNLNW